MLYDACSFMQTYGDEREILFKMRKENRLDHYTRNLLKNNIFSFHNSSEEYVRYIDKTYLKPYYDNYLIMIQNGIPYPRCVDNAMMAIQQMHIKNFLFTQDDTFCIAESERHIHDTFDIIDENNLQMVCLDNRSDEEFNPNKVIVDCCDFDREYSKGESKIWYNTPNRVLKNVGQTCMDDTSFFADLDYLRHNYYDDVYVSLPCIATGEDYLYRVKKYSDETVRLQVKKSLFRNINILGKSSGVYPTEYLFDQVCMFIGR